MIGLLHLTLKDKGRGETPKRPNTQSTPQGLDQRYKRSNIKKSLNGTPSESPSLLMPELRGVVPILSRVMNAVFLTQLY